MQFLEVQVELEGIEIGKLNLLESKFEVLLNLQILQFYLFQFI